MSKDPTVIERYTKRINVDVRSGWEEGLQGKHRIGSQLFDRKPPEHLTGQRLADWRLGHEKAGLFLATRKTHFRYKTPEGPVEFWRKGFADRQRVVKALRNKGIYGDIDVTYLEDGEIVRSHSCGY